MYTMYNHNKIYTLGSVHAEIQAPAHRASRIISPFDRKLTPYTLYNHFAEHYYNILTLRNIL